MCWMREREREMAPETRTPYSSKPTTILRHLSHRNHPLHLLFIPTEFICTACDALGSGARYRCEICDFDLHDICATCPAATATPLHPNHPLTLLNDPLSHRCCHICGDHLRGLFYTCRACDFHVHPLCTHLPLHVQLPLHHHHFFTLQPAAIAPCALCFKACTLWRYRCHACRLDIHLECVLAADPQTPLHAPPQLGCAAVCGGDYESSSGEKRRKKIYKVLGRLALAAVVISIML